MRLLFSFSKAVGLSAALLLSSVTPELHGQDGTPPETVMVTFHAKPGAEAELERVITQHWATAARMNLVLAIPHLTLRGNEDGNKTWFAEIFTWRDAGIPDAAPEAIRKIWDQKNRLVEARGGKPGLDFIPVSIVDAAATARGIATERPDAQPSRP